MKTNKLRSFRVMATMLIYLAPGYSNRKKVILRIFYTMMNVYCRSTLVLARCSGGGGGSGEWGGGGPARPCRHEPQGRDWPLIT